MYRQTAASATSSEAWPGLARRAVSKESTDPLWTGPCILQACCNGRFFQARIARDGTLRPWLERAYLMYPASVIVFSTEAWAPLSTSSTDCWPVTAAAIA